MKLVRLRGWREDLGRRVDPVDLLFPRLRDRTSTIVYRRTNHATEACCTKRAHSLAKRTTVRSRILEILFYLHIPLVFVLLLH
jgi:hypothetical protein